jgi:uncharacterized membrane protein YgcG
MLLSMQTFPQDKKGGTVMIFEMEIKEKAYEEQVRKVVGRRRYSKSYLSRMHRATFLLPLALLTLLLLGLLTACGGQQLAQNPAGTSTQDPPIPQLTAVSHGILDTTGTVPQSFITQLQARSDDVQAHGFQIAVVFFNNLASDPHQFATQVFNTNGIGYKDTNNGVLFVLYLQKPGTDGHAPWLTYITGGGISGSLPDTLMDDYVQTTFVPARAQGHWQDGLLAFYDKVSTAERDPNVAREWQTQHPQLPSQANPSSGSNYNVDPAVIGILVCLALVAWLGISAIVAFRRRENFFFTAFRLLGRLLLLLVILSRIAGGGSSSRRGGFSSNHGGFGRWGGGGSSPSSGGDV